MMELRNHRQAQNNISQHNNKKNFINLPSAKFAQTLVIVNRGIFKIGLSVSQVFRFVCV